MDRIRILVADEDPEYRSAIRDKLRRFIHEIEVVALAPNADEALFLCGTASPDVVLTNIRLPDVAGLDLSQSIRQQYPMTSVIIMAPEQQEEELFNAIRYGAAAYLLRDISAEDLVDAIKRVHAGAYVIDDNVLANPSLALRVLSAFRELTAMDQRVKPLFVPLSPRELEVLEHAARGATNRNIAREMSISEQTVKNHLGSIMRKLAVNDRTHAVVYALRQGWINVPDL